MKQEAVNISTFKSGDVITRVSPITYPDGSKEYNYIGKKFKFLGILNSLIYLEMEPPKGMDFMMEVFFGPMKKRESIKVEFPVELWEDGWAFYIEPNFDSDNKESNMTLKEIQIKNTESELAKALAAEDYEEASRLNKILDNLKKE